MLSMLVAVYEQWTKRVLFCRPGRSTVVTFVSLSVVHGEANLKTICCVQKVPLIQNAQESLEEEECSGGP
jgi:hypothetical protein